MNANEYQKLASYTLIQKIDFEIPTNEMLLLWNAVGVAGEAGEIVELAKKQIFHQHGIDVDKWKKELGDVIWYVAGCCTSLGLNLNEVMESNIEKLKERYPKGFDFNRTTFKEGKASD